MFGSCSLRRRSLGTFGVGSTGAGLDAEAPRHPAGLSATVVSPLDKAVLAFVPFRTCLSVSFQGCAS